MRARTHLLLVALLASMAIGAPTASAQIVLPGKPAEDPKEKPGNVAPHLVCKLCGERNYNARDDGRRDKDGNVIAFCSRCQKDTSQVAPGPKSKSPGSGGGGLILPKNPTAPAGPKGGAAPPPSSTPPP